MRIADAASFAEDLFAAGQLPDKTLVDKLRAGLAFFASGMVPDKKSNMPYSSGSELDGMEMTSVSKPSFVMFCKLGQCPVDRQVKIDFAAFR